jgi:transposase
MDSQPDDLATLKAELALARAKAADDAATIARQKLEIAKLKRQIYGARSERTARLLDQMELEREDNNGRGVHTQAAVPSAVPGTPSTRAHRGSRPHSLRLLRRLAPEEAR